MIELACLRDEKDAEGSEDCDAITPSSLVEMAFQCAYVQLSKLLSILLAIGVCFHQSHAFQVLTGCSWKILAPVDTTPPTSDPC